MSSKSARNSICCGCDPNFLQFTQAFNPKLPHPTPQIFLVVQHTRGGEKQSHNACKQDSASEGFPEGPVLIGRCAMTSLHSWNAATQEANGS